ncbi:XisH family protein [Calothrix sp. FACHB-1219]|uniref:XisH family protein n=1 Tax=unclassified Calothrix TaxID=2619626 RepID=UPI00168A0C5F|nr:MULTISPECIES: XisH family protein [unclassified Calothrix]MBD2207493.1 XisH family protein [Calothrix sp. FACHB-168]MBD2222094.1 XisH family protein [Calothrix sp. FACHB-1219]
MPSRDAIHETVKQALTKDGWIIKDTDDPYVISYGERFLFIDLGASKSATNSNESRLIGAEKNNNRIAIEIKEFKAKSIIKDLEQAIGQYVLYGLLLGKVDPERDIYLAISDTLYEDFFQEPIGELVIKELPLKMIIVNLQRAEITQWIS